MQPQSTQTPSRAEGFKPKYRHFHPLTRLWVQNPFDHDVVYQVADEYNRPFRYLLPAGEVSELPGGAIATLGVKHIVDELIQNSQVPGEQARMWDDNVRSKYETGYANPAGDKVPGIILRIKEAQQVENTAPGGEINLAVSTNDMPQTTQAPVAVPEEAFPGLNQPRVEPPDPAPGQGVSYGLDPLPTGVKSGIDDVIGASLPKNNVITAPNNAHASAEG